MKLPRLKRLSARRVVFFAVAAAVLAVGTIFGYKLLEAQDRDKAYDLYTIRAATMDFYYDQQRMPENLGELGGLKLRGDGKNYNLSIKDDFDYELCTHFAAKGPALHPYGFVDFTDHPWGRKCFVIDVYQTGITSAKYSLSDYPEELEEYFAQ